jgi:unsaturated chondroitin disaccharide hydrolase
MLGLAQAAHLSDKVTPLATAVADWYLANVPADRVSAWEFHPADPNAPKDTSATAIAAAAADTLAALGDQHLGRHGGLLDGCYNARQGLAPRHELIWGDYFALEAALGLPGTTAAATL